MPDKLYGYNIQTKKRDLPLEVFYENDAFAVTKSVENIYWRITHKKSGGTMREGIFYSGRPADLVGAADRFAKIPDLSSKTHSQLTNLSAKKTAQFKEAVDKIEAWFLK